MANVLQIIIQAEDRASKQLAGVSRSLGTMSQQLKVTGIALTAVGAAITGTMVAMTVKWASIGDEIAKLAQKTGFSTEALSELRHAAELSNTSLSSLETAIKRMQVVIIEAKNKTSAAAKSLHDLGLSYDELKDLTPEKQFEAITNALADIVDPTLKAALAVDTFGRSGTDLLPMLVDGSAGLNAMKKEAHDLGVVFSAEAAKKAEAFKDSITKLKAAITGISGEIAKTLAPILTKLLTFITNVIKSITDWTQKHPALTDAITKVAFAIGVLTLAVGSFILVCITVQKIAPLVGAAFHTMLGPIGLITGAISLLVIGVTALISHFGETGRAMEALKTKTKELGDTIISDLGGATRQAITDAMTMAEGQKGAIQSVIDYIKDIQTAGMELIPEDVLAKIREIRPDLAADLETIQQGVRDTNAAYDLLTDDITKARVAQIRIELDKPTLTEEQKVILGLTKTPLEIAALGLTAQEKAALLSELGTLLSGEAKRLIEKNAPDLVSILEEQQTDIDTALEIQISSWQTHWDAINKGWDGTLANLRDVVIPAMNDAIEKELLPQELIDEISGRMDELLADTEKIEAKANTITKSPWWAALSPLLAGIGAIESIKQLFQGKVPGFQHGGIATKPTLGIFGEKGPEALIPLPDLPRGGVTIVNNVGYLLGDEQSLTRFARIIQQRIMENERRTSFPQVNTGYFPGRGGV